MEGRVVEQSQALEVCEEIGVEISDVCPDCVRELRGRHMLDRMPLERGGTALHCIQCGWSCEEAR